MPCLPLAPGHRYIPPNKWAASCLAANDKAYFNFEHEESAAQPNWTLAEKEPWFEVRSYEREYEKGSIGRLLDASEWRISQALGVDEETDPDWL